MTSLISAQLALLFHMDASGRLTGTREPEPLPAPRFFLGRSAEGNAFGIRADVSEPIAAQLTELALAEPVIPIDGKPEPPVCREAAMALLGRIEVESRGPAYRLPDGLAEDPRARHIDIGGEPEVWREAFAWLAESPETYSPVTIAFEGGVPAAVCHCPRGIFGGVAEAGVFTHEAHRGKGLGTAAVVAWARAVQAVGAVALYSTSWENTGSLRIASRIGAIQYGEDWHLT